MQNYNVKVFCIYGLGVQWPTRHFSSRIAIPALHLEDDEVARVVEAVSATPHSDPVAGKMHRLLHERTRLNVLIGSAPDIAFQTLVAERPR